MKWIRHLIVVGLCLYCLRLGHDWLRENEQAKAQEHDAKIQRLIDYESAWMQNNAREISGEFGQRAREHGLKWYAIRNERVQELRKQLSTYKSPTDPYVIDVAARPSLGHSTNRAARPTNQPAAGFAPK